MLSLIYMHRVVNALTTELDPKEKERLIKDFKSVYDKNGMFDLQCQVPYLSRLAEHYESCGIDSGNDWVNLLKVR